MSEYLVSIVTPVYNSEKFISETIDSIQNQTYKHWELILVCLLYTSDAADDN